MDPWVSAERRQEEKLLSEVNDKQENENISGVFSAILEIISL
jgi:hypothetical protein